MTDLSEDRLRLHSVFRDARLDRNSYFEKLALLDGGTIALVITAVFGVRGGIGHKIYLISGVACLMLALLALLARNLIGTEIELHVAAHLVNDPVIHDPKIERHEEKLKWWFGGSERVGVAGTFTGLMLLGLEACLLLYAHS